MNHEECRRSRFRSARSHWAALAFLLVFTILVIAVCRYFLLPALEAVRHATPQEKAKLRAYASLILALILFVLVCGIMLTVRIGRFFFPRPTPPRTHTQYVDAWSESARRLETPPADDDPDSPEKGPPT